MSEIDETGEGGSFSSLEDPSLLSDLGEVPTPSGHPGRPDAAYVVGADYNEDGWSTLKYSDGTEMRGDGSVAEDAARFVRRSDELKEEVAWAENQTWETGSFDSESSDSDIFDLTDTSERSEIPERGTTAQQQKPLSEGQPFSSNRPPSDAAQLPTQAQTFPPLAGEPLDGRGPGADLEIRVVGEASDAPKTDAFQSPLAEDKTRIVVEPRPIVNGPSAALDPVGVRRGAGGMPVDSVVGATTVDPQDLALNRAAKAFAFAALIVFDAAALVIFLLQTNNGLGGGGESVRLRTGASGVGQVGSAGGAVAVGREWAGRAAQSYDDRQARLAGLQQLMAETDNKVAGLLETHGEQLDVTRNVLDGADVTIMACTPMAESLLSVPAIGAALSLKFQLQVAMPLLASCDAAEQQAQRSSTHTTTQIDIAIDAYRYIHTTATQLI